MADCRLITKREEFFSLCTQWNLLVERSVSGSFSSLWEWLTAWLEYYDDIVDSLLVILVYDDTELIGAAPFFVHQTKGPLGRNTQIRFIGTGEQENIEVASEYLDLLAIPGTEQTVCEIVRDALLKIPISWDQLIVENILEDSIFMRIFTPTMRQLGYREQSMETGQRFSVALPQTWEHYLSSLRRSVKDKILYSRRKITKRGQLSIETVTQEQDRCRTIETLRRLHSEQWSRKRLAGAFASTEFNSFHNEVTKHLADKGLLRLRKCYLDDELIGILYNILFKQKEHYYQSGFDMTRFAKFRPGLIAHSFAIQDCILAGLKQYDFMKGIRPSYKQEYGAQAIPMYTCRIFNRTIRGRYHAIRSGIRNHITTMKRKLNQSLLSDKKPSDPRS